MGSPREARDNRFGRYSSLMTHSPSTTRSGAGNPSGSFSSETSTLKPRRRLPALTARGEFYIEHSGTGPADLPYTSWWQGHVHPDRGRLRPRHVREGATDEDGVTGVLGLRLGLSEKFGVKLDGTIDYVPSPSAGTIDNYMNLGVQAGLSLLLGNSSDKDKDQVKDNVDRCAGTPSGEAVDGSGCGASQRNSDGQGKDLRTAAPIPRPARLRIARAARRNRGTPIRIRSATLRTAARTLPLARRPIRKAARKARRTTTRTR